MGLGVGDRFGPVLPVAYRADGNVAVTAAREKVVTPAVGERVDRARPLDAPEAEVRRLEGDLLFDEPPGANPLERLRLAKGLRIMWWNIEHGATNRAIGGQPLDKNLIRLAESPLAPEVIALGEYERGSLGDLTLRRLQKRYPTMTFVPYNDRSPHRGIMVMSSRSIRSEKRAHLDYTPPGMNEAAAREYRNKWAENYPDEIYFERQYLRFTIDSPAAGREINFVPVHTVQPWSKQKQSWGDGFLGKVFTGASVYLGRSNPLMYQLQRLRGELESDVLGDPRQAGTVMFGDFNLPRGGLLKTTHYKEVSRDLVDLLDANDRPSWPARSSAFAADYSPMRIDHAFASPDLGAACAEVIPLRGSDHYPVYMVVR